MTFSIRKKILQEQLNKTPEELEQLNSSVGEQLMILERKAKSAQNMMGDSKYYLNLRSQEFKKFENDITQFCEYISKSTMSKLEEIQSQLDEFAIEDKQQKTLLKQNISNMQTQKIKLSSVISNIEDTTTFLEEQLGNKKIF